VQLVDVSLIFAEPWVQIVARHPAHADHRQGLNQPAQLAPYRLQFAPLTVQPGAGALWIVGRSKELIIRSGFNVYPPEVEAVLNAHPDVTLSAVVGRKVPGNEEVVAFIQLRPGATTSADDLAVFAGEHLAPYKRYGGHRFAE